jgi:Domain of unknown function (DUF5615)
MTTDNQDTICKRIDAALTYRPRDQDLDHDILRGLIRRVPDLDAVTALEIGMSQASDPELLVWAAQERRVIVTHDRKTMPIYAADLIAGGKSIAGLFVAPRTLPLHRVIEELDLLVTCSENDEWINIITYLPL